MRNNSLYYRVFFSFWLITIAIILSIAIATSHLINYEGLSVTERGFMNRMAGNLFTYYHDTIKSPKKVERWFKELNETRQLNLYLIASDGTIIGTLPIPKKLQSVAQLIKDNKLPNDTIKSHNFIVSYTAFSVKNVHYRLAVEEMGLLTPFAHVPAKAIIIRLLVALIISALVCYLLTRVLIRPIITLKQAVSELAKGELNTRVANKISARDDEISALGKEFDLMAEKLQSLVLAKEQLLQDISHELRSPIARLQIALELAKSKTNDLAKEELERIELESIRLNELIGEILSLAKLNSQTRPLKLSHFDLSKLINDIVLDANFESRHERVFFKTPNTLNIEADKTLLARAIENIVRNALNYTPIEKNIEISIEEQPDTILIVVSDGGPGVPEDDLEKIFSPFYRVDHSREKKTGGYGLGLAITREAITLHQGNIRAQNKQDGGLKITVFLPKHSSLSA
jgi:two-component system sensor histidine kinase CpxA